MKRSYIRRQPRRNRPPIDWPALQEKVRNRDAAMVVAKLRERLDPLSATRMGAQGELPCVAWIIEGGPIRCAATKTWRLEHVLSEARMSRKAEDDSAHLVNLCEVHDERGMKAGAVWNLSHKEELRKYLREVNQ